jgi:hypothetical protein
LKCIPNRELDELGDGIIRAYLKKAGMKRLPTCVDIVGVANSLGLTVTYEQFAEEDFDKIGFLADGLTPLQVRRGNQVDSVLFPSGTIVIDTSLRKDSESGKCRFTISHEVSHHILDRHNPMPQYQRVFDTEQNYSLAEMKRRLNLVESQADKLAAALLMPRFVIDAALHTFHNGNKIRIFGAQVLAPEDRIRINKMAAQVGVSFTALLIRLRQFHLLDYHPLEEYIQSNLQMGDLA